MTVCPNSVQALSARVTDNNIRPLASSYCKCNWRTIHDLVRDKTEYAVVTTMFASRVKHSNNNSSSSSNSTATNNNNSSNNYNSSNNNKNKLNLGISFRSTGKINTFLHLSSA